MAVLKTELARRVCSWCRITMRNRGKLCPYRSLSDDYCNAAETLDDEDLQKIIIAEFRNKEKEAKC